MSTEQDWHTDSYRGMEIHVTALPHEGHEAAWDYSVRIAQPGDDSASSSELVEASGDDGDFPTAGAALEAGLAKGHTMVDRLLD